MARLTVTLRDDLHRALKEAAARRRKTIGELLEESLDFYGIKSTEAAEELVSRARDNARMTEREALELAVAETKAHRRRR
jgi:hypothetical protein